MSTLCLFFEDGNEPEKLRDAFGAMALRFWPRAILLRAGLRTDLAKACDVSETAFVFFQGMARPSTSAATRWLCRSSSRRRRALLKGGRVGRGAVRARLSL